MYECTNMTMWHMRATEHNWQSTMLMRAGEECQTQHEVVGEAAKATTGPRDGIRMHGPMLMKETSAA